MRSSEPGAEITREIVGGEYARSMPNFLIIGAEKCGTTALYHYLRQHPQVYMSPVKEPDFFSSEGKKPEELGNGSVPTDLVTDFGDYRKLFQGVSNETAIGEASPYYIYSPKAIDRIEYYVPTAKLIAVLRDPIERAYSNYLHAIWLKREPLTDFSQAIQQEEARIQSGWEALFHYQRKGFYYEQLQRYFERFGKDQIRVHLQEDLNDGPYEVLKDIFMFLQVDEKFMPDVSIRHNISGVPRHATLHTLVTRLNRPFVKRFLPTWLLRKLREPIRNWILEKPPQLDPEVRGELIEVYREDILKLQDLIQRDLSRWLK